MTYEQQLYAAIGELSVRHGYLDEEIAYFYAKLGEAIGAGVPPIEHRFFNDKLKLLAKLSEQDSNKECAERLEKWIEEADRANKLRNEAVHSTFSILEKTRADPVFADLEASKREESCRRRRDAQAFDRFQHARRQAFLIAQSEHGNRRVGAAEQATSA